MNLYGNPAEVTYKENIYFSQECPQISSLPPKFFSPKAEKLWLSTRACSQHISLAHTWLGGVVVMEGVGLVINRSRVRLPAVHHRVSTYSSTSWGIRRGVFTCVGWQETLCDLIWQVTPIPYGCHLPYEITPLRWSFINSSISS